MHFCSLKAPVVPAPQKRPFFFCSRAQNGLETDELHVQVHLHPFVGL